MAKIKVNTFSNVTPMIYAYTTPEIAKHLGWSKIGYTERNVETRIKEQSHTIDAVCKLEWKGNAIFEDGSYDTFTDKEFHAYLEKQNIERNKGTEWFHIDGPNSHVQFYNFKENRGVLKTMGIIEYTLREEQEKASSDTAEYVKNHGNGEYLWNAKPRFGKTLTSYDLCKRIDAKNVLIVTNRPAIASSWYDDYVKFIGTNEGYFFVSTADSIEGHKHVLTYKEFCTYKNGNLGAKLIYFVSLQDLKGGIDFGGEYNKLHEIAEIDWDILIIDEAHEGVDTLRTDIAFDHINRKFTLHLSGTPFKALANDKFNSNAIFNWTYKDEQERKANWSNPDLENPYLNLPKLNLFTYKMSDIIESKVEQGIEVGENIVEYAFDLNEFFTVENGRFKYNSAVDDFLDALTCQEKYPFSTDELRNELKHTLWLLNRVDSAKLLARKLQNHDVFKNYKVVLAAGDGKIEEESEYLTSFQKVTEAIRNYEKTITISVGQLTTGVTIPEWSAVLMLSNLKSPALYMQAAFRSQNPCMYRDGNAFYRKENAYVFDFDPARTLTIFEEFANDLYSDTSDGRGDTDKRKRNVKELLNFFPVIGEDENGEMIPLDAEKVLSIPRKIRSQEVVKHGFMSNFLFQNIDTIFKAPAQVIGILQQMTPAKPDETINLNDDTADDLSLDENGEVNLSKEQVIGIASDIFGNKVYGDITEQLNDTIEELTNSKKEFSTIDETIEKLKKAFNTSISKPLLDVASEKYGENLSNNTKKRLEKQINYKTQKEFERKAGDYRIQQKKHEQERTNIIETLLAQGVNDEKICEVKAEFKDKERKILEEFQSSLYKVGKQLVGEVGNIIVETTEKEKKEQEKRTIMDTVKDHLRGFSRTIPSFLMAYGDDNTTLNTFDKIIPDEVFKEVTSISLDDFRFLRDGGDYVDEETGENKHFYGNLFDQIVFDDSVKEFMNLKNKLSNYFDDENEKDIFDYIPPQKTNQIFTPRWVVKKMVDMLEEDSSCFSDPTKTFADLYMKSGLYITEIVKRLYQNETMIELYPDSEERLKHIFKHQVYGLAPTEIIYKISTNYILGFDATAHKIEHNFKQIDALEYAKEGTLEELVDSIWNK